MVSTSSGASLVKESFTPYGNRRAANTWSGAPTSTDRSTMGGVTREGYTFQTVLGSMSLNHMNGRAQDAVTGRFLSSDPVVSQPGATQGWNPYSYVVNNPLTYTDPSGFEVAELPNHGSGDPIADLNIPEVTVTGSSDDDIGGNASLQVVPGSGAGAKNEGAKDEMEEVVVNGHKPPPPQQLPCLAGATCYVQVLQGKQQQNDCFTSGVLVCQQQQPPCDQSTSCPTSNQLSSGVAVSGATVNPFTSAGGGVWGRN